MKLMCQNNLPIGTSPLIHAITNSITNEFVANSVLAIGAKPIMAEDCDELTIVCKLADAIFLNLGQLSQAKEKAIRYAARLAQEGNTPFVVDAVGITQLTNRLQLTNDLLRYSPQVIKGNISEMRALIGLGSQAKGVDGCQAEQEAHSLEELERGLKKVSLDYPTTCFLATGAKDCIAFQGQVWWLSNGVSALDLITGTGDVVGALITALLGAGLENWQACVQAVTYFNLCGERAFTLHPHALASFRQELLNQLGSLCHEQWPVNIKMEEG